MLGENPRNGFLASNFTISTGVCSLFYNLRGFPFVPTSFLDFSVSVDQVFFENCGNLVFQFCEALRRFSGTLHFSKQLVGHRPVFFTDQLTTGICGQVLTVLDFVHALLDSCKTIVIRCRAVSKACSSLFSSVLACFEIEVI